MKLKKLSIIILILFCGCGYTTRGFVYSSNKIYITPIVNKIKITNDYKRYTTFSSYPVLLETRLTNTLINKFNIDGHLKVVSTEIDALKLSGEITEYTKEVMRYTGSEDIQEQRLRLHVVMKLINPEGGVLKEKEVVGETSFFLTGPNSKSESQAQNDLINDTSRRILEAVVEEW